MIDGGNIFTNSSRLSTSATLPGRQSGRPLPADCYNRRSRCQSRPPLVRERGSHAGSCRHLFEREAAWRSPGMRPSRPWSSSSASSGAWSAPRSAAREGDCGACTVLVGVPEDGALRYRTIVSCIRPLHQLDGTHIVTIEGLTPDSGAEPDPASDGRVPWFAVRILHAGVRRRDHRLFEAADLPWTRTAADRPRRQPLPMHRLCADPRGRPVGRPALGVARSSSLYPSRVMIDELAARVECSAPDRDRARVFFRPDRLEDAVAFSGAHPGAVIAAGGTELGVAAEQAGPRAAG